MGVNQVFLANEYNLLQGKSDFIFLQNNWHYGLSLTQCSDSNRITDSGAGGTALACGERTSYGSIGEYNGQPLESITGVLKMKNKFKIGLITSVPLNHATPACFYGHEPTRKNYDNLIDDMISSKFDFFAGGGFLLGNADTSKNKYRSFEQALNSLKNSGYNLILSASEADRKIQIPAVVIDTSIRNKQLTLKNAFMDEKNSLPYTIDRPENFSTLAGYTSLAAENLMNDTGFFIMVEGGKIDWACHDNDALTTIYEINAFYESILKAYEFYLKHPENTLIIITADHETGGLSLGSGYDEYSSSNKNSYALYLNKLKQQNKSSLIEPKDFIKKVQTEAQIGWTTNEHTSSPVGVWSIGCGSEKFSVIQKNSDFKNKILSLIR